MKKVLFVFGTRPEVIKLAPLIIEMRKYPHIYDVKICNTEQQKELSNQTLDYFGLKADYSLNCMQVNQTLLEVQTRILSELDKLYKKENFDATIVQGDTITVLSGALASFYNKIPVYHVEAGLRSYNLAEPYPEEAMRQMTSRIADLNFCPTESNKQALLKENVLPEKIFITGNTVIDALFCLTEETMKKSEQFFARKNIGIDDKLVLITAHRRENHGKRLDNIISAIKFLSEKYKDHTFIIPVHPNPNVKNKINSGLGGIANVKLLEPLDYPDLVYLMKNAKLILTDSGGIQEEAPTFACPVIVLRYETERKEGIEAGVSILVGADCDKILEQSEKILSLPRSATRLTAKNPYGNGKSAQLIEQIIRERI